MYIPTLFRFVIQNDKDDKQLIVAESIIKSIRRRLPAELLEIDPLNPSESVVQFEIIDISENHELNHIVRVSPIWIQPLNTERVFWRKQVGEKNRWRNVVVSLLSTPISQHQSNIVLEDLFGYFRTQFSDMSMYAVDFLGVWNHAVKVTKPLGNYQLELWVTHNSPNWQISIENVLVEWVIGPLRENIQTESLQQKKHVWYVGASAFCLDRSRVIDQVVEYQKIHILHELITPTLTVESADACLQLANTYVQKYKKSFVERFQHNIKSAESRIAFAYNGSENTRSEYFIWQKNSRYIPELCGERWEWWMVPAIRNNEWAWQLLQYLRSLHEVDTVPTREIFVSKIHDVLKFVDSAASESAQELEHTFKSFLKDANEDRKSGSGIESLQRKIRDWKNGLRNIDLFRYGKTAYVENLPYLTESIYDDLAEDMYQTYISCVRRIRHRRDQVYSILGVICRLIVALPLINGICAGVLPPEYVDYVLWFVPWLLLIVGVLCAVFGFMRYQRYAENVRDLFVHEKFGGMLKSIAKYRFDQFRHKHGDKLQKMDDGFGEILGTFRSDNTRSQNALGVSVTSNVLTNGMQLANDFQSNKIIVGKHPAVEGTRLQRIVPQRIMSGSLRGLIGTYAWVFEYTYMQFQPSLVSLATNMLNLSADEERELSGSGAYLFLNYLLERITVDNLQVPLSAREYIGVLNEFIRSRITPLDKSLQYLDLQVFVNIIEPQGGNNRLKWLYYAASPAVDSYDVKQEHELVYLCLHNDDIGAQMELTDVVAAGATTDVGIDKLIEMKELHPSVLRVPLHEKSEVKHMLMVIHESRDEMGCLRLISAL